MFRGAAGKCNGTLSEAPCLNNVAEEENSFQVDLRVHGVSQDDIYKDEERMTEMQNLVDRLQDGYRDKSIIKDLKQEGVSNVFSEESKRKLKEMSNIELYEHSETVRTTQCPTCLRHSKEGITYCGCGKCLIPSQEQADKIRSRIDIFADPLFEVKRGRAGERQGLKRGNTITAHADQLPLQEKQLQHRLQRPHHHSRSLRTPEMKED